MNARHAAQPGDEAPESRPDPSGPIGGLPDLSALPIAGITRRRVAFLAAVFVSAWIVIVFARQVGDASAASARVDDLRASNEELAGRVAALRRESELIQRPEYVLQQARGYRLGEAGEIAFTVARKRDLPLNAPGSASVRLGATTETVTPLESWLSLLFGPGR